MDISNNQFTAIVQKMVISKFTTNLLPFAQKMVISNSQIIGHILKSGTLEYWNNGTHRNTPSSFSIPLPINQTGACQFNHAVALDSYNYLNYYI